MDTTKNIPAPDAAQGIERWITPPTTEPCPYTGLKHGQFYREFVKNPRIRQARMGTGETRGKRLLWLPDIYEDIHRRAAEQMGEGGAE